MDGSGKTTVSDIVKKTLEAKGLKVSLIYSGRGRNNVLPIQFFGKKYMKKKKTYSNHPKKGEKFEKISLIHTLSSFVFSLDMILRYWKFIKPALKKHDYVITDRYSTDILLMNKVPWWLKKILYFFIPKPKKTIYIYNDIDVLQERKPEHPREDLHRQEKIYAKIIKATKAYKVKNDVLDKTVKEVIHIIENA